jgi:WD40 repeat protein
MSDINTPIATPAPVSPAVKADPALAHVTIQWAHTSPLLCCRFDPLGEAVFAGCEDHTVQRWNLKTGAKVALPGHESWVNDLAFTPDGKTLVSAGCDGRLIWWPADAEMPAPSRRLEAHAGWVRSVSMSADGKLLASGGNDRLVRLWNAGDGSLIRELSGHESHVYTVLVHPNGEWVISGDLKGQVKQWEVSTGTLLRTFDAKALHSYNGGQQVDFGGVRSMAVSPDGKHLACGGLHNASNPLGAVHDPLVLLFEWESQKLLQSHVVSDLKGAAWRTLFHPSGFLMSVCGGSTGGHLTFWKPDKNTELFKFALPSLARDGDLHRDGLQVATAHYDRHIRITRLAAKA